MFGAGCFWGVEYNFAKLKGVREVLSGYSGGKTPNPTYEQVCSNSTEHAEVVMIDYDETQISYEELLDAFWMKHDPTTLNRQGPDVGDQYRSAIFYFDEEQQTLARESLKNLQQKLERSIVTEITKADTFWKAEEYHQKYFKKNNLRH